MKKRHYWGIRSKIILCTVLCVVAVGLGSSLYLYQSMQRVISEKIAQIDQLNAGTIAARLDDDPYLLRPANYTTAWPRC